MIDLQMAKCFTERLPYYADLTASKAAPRAVQAATLPLRNVPDNPTVQRSADKLYRYSLPNIGCIYTELAIGCSSHIVGPG
jgi:hypothetical protein